jgi:DNA-binding beta-propeller fold protein YncE
MAVKPHQKCPLCYLDGSVPLFFVDAVGGFLWVAGDGTSCFSGDGGPATQARLSYPAGIAVDASGNLYIADAGGSRVRKISPDGIISTVAGDGTQGYSGDVRPRPVHT